MEIFLPADRNTGRPRGFAFVEYSSPEGAADAIEKFDGFELKGRKLRVNEAEDRRPRPSIGFEPSPGSREGGFGRGKPKGSRRNLRGKKRSL